MHIMSHDARSITAKYYLRRLSTDDVLRIADIAADRHPKAEMFYDWLARQMACELARRSTFVDGQIPREPEPLDVTAIAAWSGQDLAAALKQVVVLDDGVSRLELGYFFRRLKMAITAIVCDRLNRDSEALPDAIARLDSDAWSTGRDFPDVQ